MGKVKQHFKKNADRYVAFTAGVAVGLLTNPRSKLSVAVADLGRRLLIEEAE